MMYVGIDLHRKRSHVAVVDERGEQLLSRRLVNDPERFRELLGELGDDDRFALEATYGWEWLAELLEAEGRELHLAHPLRTKAIASARVKTDAVDARTLAQLLRADLLREASIAPRPARPAAPALRAHADADRVEEPRARADRAPGRPARPQQAARARRPRVSRPARAATRAAGAEVAP